MTSMRTFCCYFFLTPLLIRKRYDVEIIWYGEPYAGRSARTVLWGDNVARHVLSLVVIIFYQFIVGVPIWQKLNLGSIYLKIDNDIDLSLDLDAKKSSIAKLLPLKNKNTNKVTKIRLPLAQIKSSRGS